MLAMLLIPQNYYEFCIILLYIKDLEEWLGNYILIKSCFYDMLARQKKLDTIFSIILLAPIFPFSSAFAYFIFAKCFLLFTTLLLMKIY